MLEDLDYATHAEIDLGTIRANLQAIADHVGPGTQILAPLKANAYGHGAVEVARMIQKTGAASMIGVAVVPEGVELRDAGITLPILKLSHVIVEREARSALEAGLTLTVVDEESALLVDRVAGELGVEARVQLKIDTGMRRLGAEPEQAVAIARTVAELPHIFLEGAFTHFPASDDPGQDEFTHAQIATFFDLVAQIEQVLGRPLDYVHCANSGAILAHTEAINAAAERVGVAPERRMVRPGLLSYGYYPDPSTPRTVDVHPALALRSAVSFVKPVPAGETVGYGRTWAPEVPTRIATIPIGYGDGYSRALSNRGRVLIGGASYPIVGRVCMDQIMVDVGAGSGVSMGDPVTLIGRDGDAEITCDEVAELMGTISYEVICLLSPRVARTYTG